MSVFEKLVKVQHQGSGLCIHIPETVTQLMGLTEKEKVKVSYDVLEKTFTVNKVEVENENSNRLS